MTTRLVGVTVMPEYLQSETIEAVLDRLKRSGVTAVTTSPYVMEPADEATGSREPPIDAGAGKVRLLDRPLWGGRRELWVRTSPSFEPNLDLYRGLRYQPAEPDELTSREGQVIDDFITAARAAGLKVYFQVMAAIPPGYRVQFGGPDEDDKPRLPDGRVPPNRVASNASLAAPSIVEYERALIRDLCQRYPDLDGLRIDWPEYPPYSLDDVFVDFSEHARAAATRQGFDFDAMKAAAGELYDQLTSKLTVEQLALANARSIDALLATRPRLDEWRRFKAALSAELVSEVRQTMDDSGASEMELLAHAFPPPWSTASGLDFANTGKIANGILVKLYGMHWGMMARWLGERLCAENAGVDVSQAIAAVARVLDIVEPDDEIDEAAFRYPAPDEPHPGSDDAQRRKIQLAQAAAGDAPVYTLAHGYGPLDDFRRRLAVGLEASEHGIWLNRYGYLSDAKLDAVGELCGG